MKTIIVSFALIGAAFVAFQAYPAEDMAISSGEIIVLDVVMHSIVNMYSTNELIFISYTEGGIGRKRALAAVDGNERFLKVLSKYAMEIKRQNARGDERTMDFIGKISNICTNLEQHLGAIKSAIEKGDRASRMQVDKYTAKLEMLIQSLVETDLGE